MSAPTSSGEHLPLDRLLTSSIPTADNALAVVAHPEYVANPRELSLAVEVRRLRELDRDTPAEPVHLELYGISGTTDAIADGLAGEAQWLVNQAGRYLRDAADVLRREEDTRRP